jgi:hypothetical protein
LVLGDIPGAYGTYQLAAIDPKPQRASRNASRPKFTLVLQPLPRIDPIRALKAALKRLLRDHGLRSLSVREGPPIHQPTKKDAGARPRADERVCQIATNFSAQGKAKAKRKEMNMGIDLQKYVSGRFYKLDEVFDKPAREQIAVVKEGQFDKLVLVFESGRQVSLNKTSVGMLMNEFGTDTDRWVSQWVLITAGQVKNQFGEPIDALIVRPTDAAPPASSKPAATKARKVSADMDDSIPF